VVEFLVETHLRTTECRLLYGITQCYSLLHTHINIVNEPQHPDYINAKIKITGFWSRDIFQHFRW